MRGNFKNPAKPKFMDSNYYLEIKLFEKKKSHKNGCAIECLKNHIWNYQVLKVKIIKKNSSKITKILNI